MAYYLIQVAYTPEGSAALVKSPQNRADAIRPAIEKLGGKLDGFWWSFGEYDVVAIVQFPDNASAAAFALAAGAGGAVKAYKTTPLLAAAEGVEAMKKASTTGYRPASS